MDLIEFGGHYVIAGWAEHQPEGEGDPDGGGTQYPISKDAAIWYTDGIGAEQYHTLYGDPYYDEVATSIVQVDAHHYAIGVHKTEHYQRGEVMVGDSLLVHLLNQDGTLQWTYRLGYDEAGVAPSHIIKDQNDFLVVVANRKDAGSTGYATEMVKIDPSGTQVWISPPYMPTGGATAHSLAEYGEGYITIANNQGLNHPSLVNFELNTGSIVHVQDYPSLNQYYLFGFDIDPATDKIYAAGYTFPEGIDTNAFVQEIDASYSLGASLNYGEPEAEMLYDIVVTGDGFIAGGLTNNSLSEGGWDDYILHIDHNLDVSLDETLGGPTDERFNRLMFSDNLDKAWFGGHNVELGLQESGNAYIGGVMNSLTVGASSCEFPRILLVDKLVDKTNVDNMWNLDPSNWPSIITRAQTYNFSVLMLYDVDLIFQDKKAHFNTTATISDNVVLALEAFIDAAIQAGLQVGFIVGPDIDKVTDVADVMNGLKIWNYNFATKIHYIMLEHEFWLPEDTDVLSHTSGSFNNHPYQNPVSGGSANPYSQVSPHSTDLNNYFWRLNRDHKELLSEIWAAKPADPNARKSFDYISFLKNNTKISYTPTYFDFNQQQNSNRTLPNTTPIASEQLHREQLAQEFLKVSDFTFFTFVRDGGEPNHFFPSSHSDWPSPNFDFVSTSSNWSKRFQAYCDVLCDVSKDIGKTKNLGIIPLLYNENQVCSDHSTKALGEPWFHNPQETYLGGSRTYGFVESAINIQFNQDYSCTVAACSTTSPPATYSPEPKIYGFGWFKYTCMPWASDGHDAFTGPNAHSRVACDGTYSPLSVESTKLDKGKDWVIYPNPTENIIVLQKTKEMPNDKSYEYILLDLQGRTILSGQFSGSSCSIDLAGLKAGIYFAKITSVDEGISLNSKIIKK